MKKFVIIDTETTGLNREVHRPFEVAWLPLEFDDYGNKITEHHSPMKFYNALSDKEIMQADPDALSVNGWTRTRLKKHLPLLSDETLSMREWFYDDVKGATLVGANVRFDAEMLMTIMPHSTEPWSHRLLDIQAFFAGLTKSIIVPSQHDVVAKILKDAEDNGWSVSIATPDHTAANDVRCVRDIFNALLTYYM